MNFLTELREGLAISWGAIRANKLRSVLTTLGIVIGITTVTLMGTAIEGLNNSFMKSISSIGADVLYLDRMSWFIQSRQEWAEEKKRPEISLDDVGAVQRQLNLAEAIVPVIEENTSIQFQRKSSASVSLIGTTEDFQITSGLTVADGRFLSPAECDGGRPACVLGSNIATNLFQQISPVGQKINIRHRVFEVVGVLEHQGGFGDNGSIDDQAIVPLAQFTDMFGSDQDYEIQVKARHIAEIDDASEELRAVMRRVRHLAPNVPDNFNINQQSQFLEMFHQIAGTIGMVGLFITGLSLFVGGIGIMNIMFVSVAERTREIGVRKAIGAKRRTILLQFLIEAACICLIGGAIALAIAWPVTLLMQKIMPASLSPMVVGVSLLVSAVTGVLSGFFPAWRAARMNPVDALRNE